MRDEEVRELADRAARGARAIITEHRHSLEELAATLLANEVIERADIDRIMLGVPRAAPERRPPGIFEWRRRRSPRHRLGQGDTR